MQNESRTKTPVRLTAFIVILLLTGASLQAQDKPSDPGKLKEWSFVYQGTFLKTVAGNTYTVHSAGLNYTSRNDWRRPLLSSTTIFVPAGIMNEESLVQQTG